MKKLLCLFLFLSVSAFAGTFHCIWNFEDFTTANLGVRQVTIQTLAKYGTNTNTPAIIPGDLKSYRTTTNTSLTVSNMLNGRSYRVSFYGPLTPWGTNLVTIITNSFDADVTGLVNANNYITVPITEGSTVAYSQTTSDSRFHNVSGDTSTNATFRGTLTMPATSVNGYVWTATNATGAGFWAVATGGGTVQTNISYTAVTNAPWLTNNETRNVTLFGDLNFSGTTHAGLSLNILTTAQRDALSAAEAMLIYNSTTDTFDGFEQASPAWHQLLYADGTGSSLTALNGSAITSGTVNFARLGTGGGGATKFLREDNTWQTAGNALTSNPLSQFAATTSAQLRGVLSDETGEGEALFDYGFFADGTNTFRDKVVFTNAAAADSYSMIWFNTMGVLRITNSSAASTYLDIAQTGWTNSSAGSISRMTGTSLFINANIESMTGQFLSRGTIGATANGVGFAVNGGGGLRWASSGVARLVNDTAAGDSTLWLGQTATGWPYFTGTSNATPQITIGGALVVTNLNPGASVLALGVTSSGQLTTNGVAGGGGGETNLVRVLQIGSDASGQSATNFNLISVSNLLERIETVEYATGSNIVLNFAFGGGRLLLTNNACVTNITGLSSNAWKHTYQLLTAQGTIGGWTLCFHTNLANFQGGTNGIFQIATNVAAENTFYLETAYFGTNVNVGQGVNWKKL